MKKWIVFILALVMCTAIIGCQDQTSSPPSASTESIETMAPETTPTGNQVSAYNTFCVGNLEFTLDSDMSIEENGENIYTVTLIQDKAMLVMFAADISSISEDLVSAYVEMQHKTVTADADHSSGVTEFDVEICGFPTISESYGVVNESQSTAYLDISFTDSWYAYSFHYAAAVTDNDDAYNCAKLCGEFLATAKYVGDTPREILSGASASSNSSSATIGEQNALKSADSYLKYSAFSYSGLIDQLEYEGYTSAEATYAADNCGANWKEQALKSAESYLKYSSFSYTGLINQLEYEGFTTEEATYGADSCGADWFEQAAKSAESYLKYSSFSRQGLIDQLEYEGFTNEQAVYGVEQNGY